MRTESQETVYCVKRVALILTTCIVADCPFGSTCVVNATDDVGKVTCDYYHGSTTGLDNSRVNCSYLES